jgi:hypothetical protein
VVGVVLVVVAVDDLLVVAVDDLLVVGVLPAAVVVVVEGAVVVVDEFFCVVVVLCFFGGLALGVPDPHAAAINPPARTMVPMSHRFPVRRGAAPDSSGVTRVNTYCSSPRCGANAAKRKARPFGPPLPIEPS